MEITATIYLSFYVTQTVVQVEIELARPLFVLVVAV